ncbi:hypothetical protein INT45_010406 [Circinella minor]|uniref:Condensation domain-containing protein n=1 Tax=Circinella minor TaxID=1195481 RepID=A0A8H7VDW4_9FUNG|nr:hypothetical protein INT45_010406 [Circinella minor]
MSTTVERSLGLLEKYQLSKHLTQCYGTVTATATLRHIPRNNTQFDDPKQFYLAQLQVPLTSLIEKHPQLSLVVGENDKQTAHFIRLNQIDLYEIINVEQQVPFWDRSKLAQVIASECDHEFNFNDQTVPLWHLHICTHDDRLDECTITLTAHHVIADGKSLSIFWQGLLHEINKVKLQSKQLTDKHEDGYVIKPKVETILGLPYEDRQAPMPTAWNMIGVVSRMIAKKALPDLLTKTWFPQGWAGDHPGITDKAKARHDTVVRTIELGGVTWNDVCTTCRKHGVTPHAAIMVAVVSAFAEVYRQEKIVSTSTPVNCRSFCTPAVPENEMGNFVGSYSHTWKKLPQLLSGGDFWDMAKTYQTQLKANKGEAAKEAGLLKYLSKYPEDYCDFWYDHWVSNPTMHRAGGIELSDLGKFVPPTDDNDIWKIESIWFCQSTQIFTTALNVNSISTKDSMYATIGWQNGSLEGSKAEAFGQAVIRNLQKCCH